MAITYPLTPPQIGTSAVIPAESITWTYYTACAKVKSPFTARSYITEYDGKTMLAQISLPTLQADDARRWRAFLVALRGSVGTFWLGDPTCKEPLGNVTGCNLVFDTGNGQIGQAIKIRGAVANRQGVLLPGDNIQIGSRLYIVLEQANAGSDGKFLVDVFPSLRDLPADGTAVITTNPRGLFRLVDNTTTWSTNTAGMTNISFNAEEAI